MERQGPLRNSSGRSAWAVLSVLVSAGLLLSQGGAHAQSTSSRRILEAGITASSSSGKARRAFDADVRTAWCPAASDAGGEVEIKFTEPVRVRALSIYVGRMDPTRMSAEDYHPVPISAVWDTGEVTLEPAENGQNALEIPQVAGQRVTRLLLRLPRAPGLDRCLSEVELELEEGPWVHGLPSAAIAALPQAVAAITRAFHACDARELSRHALFPLTSRKLLGEHGTLSRMFSTTRTPSYPNARALTRDCRGWVVSSDDEEGRQPHVIGSEAPGTVRVWANYHAGVKYWRLRWDGRRWWLVGFDANDFE